LDKGKRGRGGEDARRKPTSLGSFLAGDGEGWVTATGKTANCGCNRRWNVWEFRKGQKES